MSKGAGQRLPKEREMHVGYRYFGHFANAMLLTGSNANPRYFCTQFHSFFEICTGRIWLLKYINVINAGLVANFK